ncbi:MAG: HAD family hydrolase [Lachnospiraceae bacterium]|nr:HAD family hydrolase [Lachnospiraceae bacterium]
MIKLIASDIDGTLVPDGSGEINAEIYDVIRKLREKGVVFTAASGRQFSSIEHLFHPIAKEIYYITDGGAVLRDYDTIYSVSTIDTDMAREMAEEIIAIPECEVTLCGEKFTYVLDKETEMAHWLSDSYHFKVREIASIYETPEDDPLIKVSLYHKTAAEEKAAPHFIPKWQDKLQMSCAGVMWIDCIHKHASKGAKLKELQKKLGITPEETMVFGDNINDLEMMESAGYSVAIGNARPEVKAKANFIADRNVNDGVLKVLKKLLLTL